MTLLEALKRLETESGMEAVIPDGDVRSTIRIRDDGTLMSLYEGRPFSDDPLDSDMGMYESELRSDQWTVRQIPEEK